MSTGGLDLNQPTEIYSTVESWQRATVDRPLEENTTSSYTIQSWTSQPWTESWNPAPSISASFGSLSIIFGQFSFGRIEWPAVKKIHLESFSIEITTGKDHIRNITIFKHTLWGSRRGWWPAKMKAKYTKQSGGLYLYFHNISLKRWISFSFTLCMNANDSSLSANLISHTLSKTFQLNFEKKNTIWFIGR